MPISEEVKALRQLNKQVGELYKAFGTLNKTMGDIRDQIRVAVDTMSHAKESGDEKNE